MVEPNPKSSPSQEVWWIGLLALTALNCALQIGWFWRFRAKNITSDGIAYIGLARHLVDGNIKASLHGYWSPLTSWIIAVNAIFGRNFTLLGRLVTISSFLVCLPLLYTLTHKLWRSKVAAALAVFWFSIARGIVFLAVGSIVADFVLTACVLLYFIQLLAVLRDARPAAWVLLGAAHALAFLAKAIAMPWLSIATVLAVLVRNARLPRRMVTSLLLAFIVPAAVWLSWGMALRTKYGVFTTGYQLRANLMINWRRTLSHHPRGDALAFADTRSVNDEYMVGETSWTELQHFSLRNARLLPMVLKAEITNLPQAVKECVILLTPAGALALILMLVLLVQNVRRFQPEAAFTCITLISVVAVITAYCMLVFDGRYVVPIAPVLIAIGCPALVAHAGSAPAVPDALRRSLQALFIASVAFFAVYWASPFRSIDRDFEVSCYQAADALRGSAASGTLVSIGDGPYPEHGVGFEVGSYVAYFAGWRLIGGNSELPEFSAADDLAARALAMKSDAIAIWGSPANATYDRIVEQVEHSSRSSSASKIKDPYKGEVGTVILIRTGS